MTIYNVSGSEAEKRLFNLLQSNVANHQQLIDLYRQIVTANP